MTFDPAAAGWSLHEPSGLPPMLQTQLWTRAEGDDILFGYEALAGHTNARGVIHGGILATFIDHTLGLTVRRAIGGGTNLATIQLDIHYIAAGMPGQFIQGRGVITRKTRSVVFIRGDLTAGDTMLVSATGIWKVLAPEAGR